MLSSCGFRDFIVRGSFGNNHKKAGRREKFTRDARFASIHQLIGGGFRSWKNSRSSKTTKVPEADRKCLKSLVNIS
ncbi:hypothetical protein CHUAL_000063 [Chamberlinius hualienensis]